MTQVGKRTAGGSPLSQEALPTLSMGVAQAVLFKAAATDL